MPGGLQRVVQDGLALLGTSLVSERSRIEQPKDYMRPISAEKLVYSLDLGFQEESSSKFIR
jgi:hypothetical protein